MWLESFQLSLYTEEISRKCQLGTQFSLRSTTEIPLKRTPSFCKMTPVKQSIPKAWGRNGQLWPDKVTALRPPTHLPGAGDRKQPSGKGRGVIPGKKSSTEQKGERREKSKSSILKQVI